MKDDGEQVLWCCIAKCHVCGLVLNTARNVPDHARTQVIMSAPLVCICTECGHNTLSDCNIGVDLEWFTEPADAMIAAAKGADDE